MSAIGHMEYAWRIPQWYISLTFVSHRESHELIKTCSKCGEEFDLLPGKPALATVCPRCEKAIQDDEWLAILGLIKVPDSSRFTVNVPIEHKSRPRKPD